MLNDIVRFLQGKKTYIVAVAMVVVAGLSYFDVLPHVDTMVATMVGVAGIAVTLHAAFTRVMGEVLEEAKKE